MLAVSRRQRILELLDAKQIVVVSELSKELQVTEETVRKDLQKLEKEGALRRIHGGAVPADASLSGELPFELRKTQHVREKQAIAAEAVKLIGEGSVIALDTSSTSLHIAYLLQNRRHLTVITNSFHVVDALKTNSHIRLISTGGHFRTESLSFSGEIAERALEQYGIDQAFVSTRGVTLDRGLLEPHEQEARMKKKLIERVRQVVLLCDGSKFGQSALYPIATLERVDTLITDSGAPPAYLRYMEQMGKPAIVAAAFIPHE
ncbi:MAG: DeoR/GlpR transcriptional regulator [Paenibacillus sp.]|jgi:DeoR/GlpR family transcriptional regulator of sugar metabolism|nr:DeoR/GlpR transcriptional regulator [Paenibacillus sp.]